MGSDLTIECMSVVKPNTVDWMFSSDGGENWTAVEKGKNGLELKIKKISAEDNGKKSCNYNTTYYLLSAV